MIEGCEAAWRFFGGVFRVLIPDNASAIVADADAVNPRLAVGWLDYTQHCGFSTDAARVRSPKDKPRVERAVQYVRGNFFAGEDFVDLADAQARAQMWCRETAGLGIHGTIAARPAEVFAECEAAALGAVPDPYDVPIFTRVKVHRDFHIEVGKALYSAPRAYLGEHLDVRADSALVKLFSRGQLVKVHPRQRPGGRVTDPEDLPEHKAGYALRDLDRLVAAAGKHGPEVGTYAQRLLDDTLPWTKMRQVYRLLGLARRYGDTPVNTACARALALDVVSVTKIASMLEQASENTPAPLATAGGQRRGPFRPRPGRVHPAPADAHAHQRRPGSAVMRTADLLDSIRAHLAEFELPDLYSVNVTQSVSGASVTAQLACHTPPQTGSALLAWADTLAEVTAEAWRVPSGQDVHLSVIGRLPGGASIRVYAGVVFTEHGIGADLPPDVSTTVALATLQKRVTLKKMTT